MEKILILGAGPQARVIPDVVDHCPGQELIGFVDEGGERGGEGFRFDARTERGMGQQERITRHRLHRWVRVRRDHHAPFPEQWRCRNGRDK